MIGELIGVPKKGLDNGLIVSVGGVGYSVMVLPNKLEKLLSAKEIRLFIYTNFRDKIDLFGFEKEEEYRLFSKLVTISGIGPRTALSILSSAEVGDLVSAIVSKNVELLVGGYGLPKRYANKLVLELGSKLELIDGKHSTVSKEVLEALSALGYEGRTAHQAAKASAEKGGELEEQVRYALQQISGGINKSQ